MAGRTLFVAVEIVALLVLDVAAAAPAPPPAMAAQKLALAKRDAARRTYEAVWKNNREALVPLVELVYRWSRRWMEAEQELSSKKEDRIVALRAHWNRMLALERITRERFRAKVIPLEEASAAEFYSLEAEIWLTQEENKDKRQP